MYCSNCGTYCAGGSFCPRCGMPTNNVSTGWYSTGYVPQAPYAPRAYYPPQAYPPQIPRAADTPEKAMKRAFNRGGLSVLALYGSFSVLGTAFLYIAVIIAFMGSGYAMSGQELSDVLYASDALESPAALFVILSYVIGMTLGMIIGIRIMKKILSRIKPVVPEARGLSAKEFFLAMAFALGAWGLGVAVGNLPNIVFPSEGTEEWLYDALGMNMLPFYIYTIIGAPILEEFSFRKVLCGGLSKFGKAPAVIVSALLFGLMHRNSGQFSLAFFVGLVFGCVYLYSGKIIYTIIFHGIINLVGTLPQLFALGNVDITLGWEIAIGVLGLIGLVLIVVFRKHPMLRPEPSPIPNSRKAVFANVGMRIAVIGGLVFTVLVDVYTLIVQSIVGMDSQFLLSILVTLITVALVIVTMTCTCRGASPEIIESEQR